jgi:hypothetical protein
MAGKERTISEKHLPLLHLPRIHLSSPPLLSRTPLLFTPLLSTPLLCTPLQLKDVRDVDGNPTATKGKKNCFAIKMDTDKSVYTFSADSEDEKYVNPPPPPSV